MRSTDCRCKNCFALLAKVGPDGLSIQRSDMQTTVTGGGSTVTMVCYKCGAPNVVVLPGGAASAASTPARKGRSPP